MASAARSCGSGKFVAVFERFVFEPRHVELITALLDLAACETAEAAHLAEVFAFAQAVRVGAVALLELGEVLRGERAVLLGDAGHVGARVENPDVLGGSAFL